jgi:sulfur transfer protein SufE
MTLRERQNRFIADMALFDGWTDRFNFLISESYKLPEKCPDYLLPYRIESCQSKTCYKVWTQDNHIQSSGWSNSAIMGGLLVSVMNIVNLSPIEELLRTPIDFHTQTGLVDNFTLMRHATLSEIIRRITAICSVRAD